MTHWLAILLGVQSCDLRLCDDVQWLSQKSCRRGSKFWVVATALRQGILKTRVTFIPNFWYRNPYFLLVVNISIESDGPIGVSVTSVRLRQWSKLSWLTTQVQNRCRLVTIWRLRPSDVKVLSASLGEISLLPHCDLPLYSQGKFFRPSSNRLCQ